MEWLPTTGAVQSEDDGTLSRVLCGRIAAIALVRVQRPAGGVLAAGPRGEVDGHGVAHRRTVSLVAGVIAWWLPWDRFGRWAVLATVPFAFASVDLT